MFVQQVWGSFLQFISKPHFTDISFPHHPFHGNTRAKQIDLLTSEWLHSSVAESSSTASKWSWVRVPLKTSEIFQVHPWDNRLDCPESLRVISSIQRRRSETHFEREAEGTRKWPIGSVLSCTFANFMPSPLDQGKYFHWNSFSMTVPAGSCLQFWSPLAGLPWKPPHYASYFHWAPPTFDGTSPQAHLLGLRLTVLYRNDIMVIQILPFAVFAIIMLSSP